ncbi:hypothetical protein FRC01_002362 [Tulasnella sp. 417]|nr:hypothetical protein FRC01_002362 [Tulasnella sp. 417]
MIDPAGWRGKSLDEIAATLRSRAVPIVPQPIANATLTPSLSSSDGKTHDGERSRLTAPSPATLARLPSGFQVRVEEGGFSIRPVENASRESKRDVHTSVGAGGMNDWPDDEGFLKSDVDRAYIESAQRLRGIETAAVQTLLPPLPAPLAVSTGIEPEVVASLALPPPLPPVAAGEKLKGASRTKKIVKKMVKRVKSAFTPKNRGQ